MNELRPVDHAAIAVNQAAIITLLVIAFVLNSPLVVGLVGLVMFTGALLGAPGFLWLYTRALRPLGMVRPDVLQDNPEPHRFAQGFGALVVLGGFAALQVGFAGLGWALAWLVVGLASLNLFAGFCAGCAMYYWLSRLHAPGFTKAPPAGIRPGLRPRHFRVVRK